MNNDLDIQEVLYHLREVIGVQAQEIAVLKASLIKLQREAATSKDKVE
jgi:hypothetical protein